jgi:phytoene synthase
MADHRAHCEALVRAEDKDRFLATLFAPARCRPALLALYAFDLETARVANLVKEPMAGQIRLQWWRDVIVGAAHAGGSPVATGLIEAMQEFSLPVEPLVRLLDARDEALDPDACDTMESVESRVMRAAAPVFELAARILNDGTTADVARLCEDAGAAFGLMRTMPSDQAARAIAAERLSRAGSALTRVPERLWPAFLPLAPIRSLLARDGRALPQWRRQWIMWRSARNLPAALN